MNTDDSKTPRKAGMVPFSKSSRMAKNDQKWEPYKEEIRGVYLKENNTLEFTMERIEKGHGFKASERKWKEKLKDWGFEKYLSTESMKIILTKAEKRARDEGKDTVFFHGDNQVTEERIEGFKRRKFSKEEDGVSPRINTPENVTYYTPRPELIIPSETTPGEENYPDSQARLKDFPTTLSRPLSQTASDAAASEVLKPQAHCVEVTQNDASGANEMEISSTTDTRLDDSLASCFALSTIATTAPSTLFDSISSLPVADPVNTKMAASLVTPVGTNGAKVNQVAVKALADRTNRELDEVTSHCEIVLQQSEGTDFLNALQELSSIADEYLFREDYIYDQHIDGFAKSASIYRMVVAGLQQHFGALSMESLQPTVKLAKVLKRMDQFAEAEAEFRKAIAGYELFGMEDASLECQCLLGEILIYIKNKLGAENCLISALAKCLKRGLVTQMTAVTTLCQVNLQQRATDMGREYEPLFSHMLNILREQNSIPARQSQLCPEILFEAVKIASEYSVIQNSECSEYDYASPLFSAVFLQIGQLSNVTHGDKKAQAYIRYALHSQRQQNWGECLSHLSMATKSVRCVKGGDMFALNKLECSLENLNRELCTCEGTEIIELFERKVDEMRGTLESSLEAEDSPWELTKDRVEQIKQSFTILALSKTSGPTSSDAKSMSSRSHRYGTTYSTPSIAGISDSAVIADYLPFPQQQPIDPFYGR